MGSACLTLRGELCPINRKARTKASRRQKSRLRHPDPRVKRKGGEWNENETKERIEGLRASGIEVRGGPGLIGGMPQIQLPIFPAGSVEINSNLACRCENGTVVYFHGHLPVFSHGSLDVASFRMFTSQLIVQGSAKQGDIQKAFGVSLTTIKRATKLYRTRGAAGFFAPKPRREGAQLTDEKIDQARVLLSAGAPLARISELTGVLSDTLRKAISAGRLPGVKKKPRPRLGSMVSAQTG